MFAYKLGIRDPQGILKEIIAPGWGLANAIENAGIHSDHVLSADFCFDWRALTPKLTKKNQLIFLIKLLPFYVAGLPAAAEKVYRNFRPVEKLALRTPEILNRNASLSERLTELRFNSAVLALISVGEKTGEISKHLEAAISNLQTDIEIEKKARGGLTKGLIIFSLSIFVLLAVSSATTESLNSMTAAGLISEHNFAGKLLMLLGIYSQKWLWTLPIIIGGTVACCYYYFEQTSAYWPLSLLRRYQNILRSIRLVNAWRSLEQAGLVLEKEKKLLSAILGSKIATKIFIELDKGRTFSELLDESSFSPTLQECCAEQAANSNTISRSKLLKQISKILIMELEDTSQTISKTFYLIGFAIGISAIFLMVWGVLVPIWSTTLSVGAEVGG